jgi:hypothetical protein
MKTITMTTPTVVAQHADYNNDYTFTAENTSTGLFLKWDISLKTPYGRTPHLFNHWKPMTKETNPGLQALRSPK